MTTCTRCGDVRGDVVTTLPAGRERAADIAGETAVLDQLTTGADTHVHYRARGDRYVIVRPTARASGVSA